MKTAVMNEQRVTEIIGFWKQKTGRAGPKKISFDGESLNSGLFHQGEISLHPKWADEEVVFHELTHLEQFQDGRLLRVENLPYEEQPAELEAWEKAKEWVKLWKEFEKE